MRRTYDPEVDVLYVELSNARILESEEVRPDVIFDFDDEGRIVGIEVLNARRRVAPGALFDTLAAE